MEAVTTIRKMLANNRIFVPSYQRAYSWDTDTEGASPKQIIWGAFEPQGIGDTQ